MTLTGNSSLWLENPAKAPEGVDIGMSLRSGEGMVGERNGDGVGGPHKLSRSYVLFSLLYFAKCSVPAFLLNEVLGEGQGHKR